MTATHVPFSSRFDGARGARFGRAAPDSASELSDYDAPAAALVHGLSRPVREESAWGPGRSFCWSLLTVGLVPALAWPADFQRFAAVEREQMLRLAEWMGARVAQPQASRLREVAARMGAWGWLSAVPAVMCLAVFLVFAGNGVHDVQNVLRHTYLFRHGPRVGGFASGLSLPFLAWNVGLTLAYMSQALAIFLHRLDVERFVTAFNHLAVAEGIDPVRLGTDRPLRERGWLVVVAILLFAFKAPWGVAMAVAGFDRKREMLRAAPALRAAFAARVTYLVMRRRGLATAEASPPARCSREGCGAKVARGARFCPRCGAATELATAAARSGAGR